MIFSTEEIKSIMGEALSYCRCEHEVECDFDDVKFTWWCLIGGNTYSLKFKMPLSDLLKHTRESLIDLWADDLYVAVTDIETNDENFTTGVLH